MWSQAVMALLGIWMMITPDLLGYSKKIADNAHIVGPLIATFSIIAIWECTRNARLLNLSMAIWLLAAPVVLKYENDTALMNDYGVAILIIFLLLVKPKHKYRFGGGWPSLWHSNSAHSREAANLRRSSR